jgi:hypothetical protein
MARGERPPDDRGKVKFRFVEFEMEGGSANLEQTIKNIAHAIISGNAPMRTQIPQRQINQAAPPPDPNGAGEREVEVEHEMIDPTAADGDGTGGPQGPRTTAKRKYTAPTFLQELDLDTAPSLKGFVDEYGPSSDNERYLVIAAWFKQHRGLDAIGIDHIYTAFQKIGRKSQKDIGQPFRWMMRNKSYFTSSQRGMFAITHIGLDELPKIKEKKQ